MNMKRMTAAALSVLMLAALTACGGNASKTPATTAAPVTTAANGQKQPAGSISYSYKTESGVEIAISAPSDPIVEQLGKPAETFEAPSCAFSGTSYTYTFDKFKLETYPEDNTNKVYAVTLLEGAVTPEGLKIGDSAEDVKTVCGEPGRSTDAYMMYQSGDNALQFFLSGGKVSEIVYTMVV